MTRLSEASIQDVRLIPSRPHGQLQQINAKFAGKAGEDAAVIEKLRAQARLLEDAVGDIQKEADRMLDAAKNADNVDAPRGPVAGGGADLARALENMTPDEVRRIQNAANRIGEPIRVVGSRSGGPKLPRTGSDWDFVIEANNKTRRSAARSLPGAKSVQQERIGTKTYSSDR